MAREAIPLNGVNLAIPGKSWMRNLIVAPDSSNRTAKMCAEHPLDKPMKQAILAGLMVALTYDQALPFPPPDHPVEV